MYELGATSNRCPKWRVAHWKWLPDANSLSHEMRVYASCKWTEGWKHSSLHSWGPSPVPDLSETHRHILIRAWILLGQSSGLAVDEALFRVHIHLPQSYLILTVWCKGTCRWGVLCMQHPSSVQPIDALRHKRRILSETYWGGIENKGGYRARKNKDWNIFWHVQAQE